MLQTETMDLATALPLLDHAIQQIHAKRDDENVLTFGPSGPQTQW